MKKILQSQISTLLEEMEMIEDNYQRADIRVRLITALAESTSIESIDIPKGKEAYKNNKKKTTPRKVQLEDIEETVQETLDISESLAVKEELKEEDIPKPQKEIIEQPKEEVLEVEEEVKQEEIKQDLQPQKEILEDEPIIIEYIDENDETQTLDITQAWHIVGDEEGSQERVELAKNLTEYNLLPIYETFTNLDHSYNKMMLSYYMQQYSLEDINEFIENLTEGMYNDVYEFVNNNNLEGLIISIENAIEE